MKVKSFIFAVFGMSTLLSAQNNSVNSGSSQATLLNVQGFRIEVKTPDLPVDSLFIFVYSYSKKQFRPVYGIKYASEAVFTDTNYLVPGLYLLNADSNNVLEFLISDNKHQRFSINIKSNAVVFDGSDENTANLQYTLSVREYDQQTKALDTIFQQIEQSNESFAEKQTRIDSIVLQYRAITRRKLDYQAKVVKENKGSLLASIILATMEVPPPPTMKDYTDRTRYFKYLAEYCFYKYDFSDDRILATPLANNKFRTFNEIISELDDKDAIPYVLDALRKSQVSPQHYYDFFDYLEQDFGLSKSPFRKETLYIAMLHYAIDSTYIDPYRKERYLYELNIINKNHPGEKIPNFPLIMGNGDTTDLYAIEAEHLLLYLQSIDCQACTKTREKMKEIEALNKAIADKKITVLTIYSEDDKNLWQNYIENNANPNWIHGWNYDAAIEDKHLIDARSTPCMYLLDKNKTILKKNMKIYELEMLNLWF